MLDLWQNDQARALAPQPGEATQFPATFGEGFDAAWNEGRLFSQSVANENSSMEALGDYLDEVKQKTGKDIPLDYGDGENAPSASALWMQANDAVGQMKAKDPALDIAPLSMDEIQQRAIAKSRGAVQQAADVTGREMTTGGRVGFMLGGLAATATDPINLAAMPLAPEESLGVLGSALRFGVIGAGAQAGIEAAGGSFREQVQPGYLESGAPLENIAGAGVGAAVLGGGFKAAGNLWTRLKSGAWPTSVRDAGNVVESEANIQGSNVYPGIDGDAAHRQALSSAIDSILGNKPIDVGDIITPDIEAQSRNLMMRLQGERAFSLPVFDERSIRLTSEEAQLREQDAALAGQLSGLPEGDLSAADRLNRLQTVEQQIANAPDAATRRALNERRDQILVDTTPEALQQGAAPIAQRQALGAQRGQIASRLNEIAAERQQIEADNLGRTVQPLGQTMPIRPAAESPVEAEPVRAVPILQTRALAARLAEEAKAAGRETSTVEQPELPFEANAAVAHMRTANEVLAGGVQQIARRAGYEMPDEEAARVADKLVKATPGEADDLLRDLQMSPRQVADAPINGREPALEGATAVEPAAQVVKSPDYQNALQADIDRERVAGDKQIPVGVDADGNIVRRSIDAAMNEVEAYKTAADQLAACAAPEPAEPEKEAA